MGEGGGTGFGEYEESLQGVERIKNLRFIVRNNELEEDLENTPGTNYGFLPITLKAAVYFVETSSAVHHISSGLEWLF